MDFNMLIQMFVPFTLELLIGSIILFNKPLDFRFKAPISIIGGLLISSLTTFGVILYLHFFCSFENWKELINIISFLIPFIGVYFALLFAYKQNAMKLILTVTIAYTFQAACYHLFVVLLDTGIQSELYKQFGEDWYVNVYPVVSEIFKGVTKISIYVLLYFTIAKLYRNYHKYNGALLISSCI